MPQIHIKLNSRTHKELLRKAKKYNYSIQEFVERSLMMVAEESQPYFTFRKPESESRDYKFTFIDLFAGIGGIRLSFERTEANASFPLNGTDGARRLILKISVRFPTVTSTK